jgi:hypothetical protein
MMQRMLALSHTFNAVAQGNGLRVAMGHHEGGDACLLQDGTKLND